MSELRTPAGRGCAVLSNRSSNGARLLPSFSMASEAVTVNTIWAGGIKFGAPDAQRTQWGDASRPTCEVAAARVDARSLVCGCLLVQMFLERLRLLSCLQSVQRGCCARHIPA